MATLILKPSSDTSLKHTSSSILYGSGYGSINDSSNSTYISQSLTSTSSTSLTSTFGLAVNSTPSTYHIRVTHVRGYVTSRISSTSYANNCQFSIGLTCEGSQAINASSSITSTSFSNEGLDFSGAINVINNKLTGNNFPTFSFSLTTSGQNPSYNRNKSSSTTGTIQISEVYFEIDYEIDNGSQKFYYKDNGVWKEVQKAYIKQNGVWVEKAFADLPNSGQFVRRG